MKREKIIIISIIILVLCIVVLATNIDKDFHFDTKDYIIEQKDYTIKIKTINSNSNKLNSKINEIINKAKDSFLKENRNKGSLIIDYEYTRYKDIYTFHISSEESIKKILKRKDYIIYYEAKERKILEQKSLIKRDIGLYAILNSKCIDYLEEKKIADYNEELLEIDDKNYQLLSFSNSTLHVILINNNKEFDIPIEYIYIKEYLSNNYFKIEDTKKTEEKQEIVITEEKEENEQEDIDKTDELNLPKYLAFTFDDGPNKETTTTLLDGLKERNAKVTFFVLGNRAINQPELIKRMANEGHLVGSHTYSHKNLLKLSLEDALNDINRTNDVLNNITGISTKYLRPPYGNYNNSILENSNMVFILWSVDTEDWKNRDSELVYEYIINNVNDGDIILLHDLYPTSVEGVLKAIDYLKNDNYQFVTIDELFNKKGIVPETNKSYRYVK